MKINLLLDNPDGYIPGYLNFDPMAKPGCNTVLTDITNLDEYIDSACCYEIRANNILSFFDANKIDKMLDNWISKLRRTGVLFISDIDIIQTCKAFQRGELSIDVLNEVLYGQQVRKWDLRKHGLSLNRVSETLIGRGLTVEEKGFDGLYFFIKAVRL